MYWLQINPYANWDQLVEALKSEGVELNAVATTVERLFPGLSIIT